MSNRIIDMLDDVPSVVYDITSGIIGTLVAIMFLAEPVALYPLGRFYFAVFGGFTAGFLRDGDIRRSGIAAFYFISIAVLWRG